MELQPPVTQYIHYVIHTSEFLCDLNCKKIYSSVKHSTRYSKYYLQPLMFTRALIPEKKKKWKITAKKHSSNKSFTCKLIGGCWNRLGKVSQNGLNLVSFKCADK